MCLIPASARFLRSDLRYRLIDDQQATSPVVMSYRRNEDPALIALLRQLIAQSTLR